MGQEVAELPEDGSTALINPLRRSQALESLLRNGGPATSCFPDMASGDGGGLSAAGTGREAAGTRTRCACTLCVVPQSDRAIPEKDKCPACSGSGWTWFEAEPEGRWIVCRECIGTGRLDQKGRKRVRPDEVA